MTVLASPNGHFAPRKNLWSKLTRNEIVSARDAGSLVVIPTGSTEQHGAHLAVGTDAFLVTAITELASARVHEPTVLVTPPVDVGFSPHHASWPGTLSLRLTTYLQLIKDVALSVVNSGFPRVLIVNGHGGNSAPLKALCAELVTDGNAIGCIDYFTPSQKQWSKLLCGSFKEVGHACEYETALYLALAESDEVTQILENVESAPPRLTQPWIKENTTDPITNYGASWPPIFQANDCGYRGDPAVATVVSGKRILEVTVEQLSNFFREFSLVELRVGSAYEAFADTIFEDEHSKN